MMHRRMVARLVGGFILGLSYAPLQGQELDSDHDGVPDGMDRCPNTAQLKTVSADFRFAEAVNPGRLKAGAKAYPVDAAGCELDDDGDGVANSQDYCPDDPPEALSAGIAANGCPKHSDFDGTPDYRDRCPDTPKGIATDAQGCPLLADDSGPIR